MKFIYLIVISCLVQKGFAQMQNFHGKIEAQAIVTTPGSVPFWFRSNQFGSIPFSKSSLSLIPSFRKDYNPEKKLIDWGIGFEGRANGGAKLQFMLIEGYAKVRLGIFELKGGRSKDMMGITDSTLSSGSFSISGNALGIPKVQISIPEFYTLPFFGKLFAFKGNYAHGWIGNTQVNSTLDPKVNTYFHQKSLYARFGKSEWRTKLYAGFNHQVFWGHEQSMYGSLWTMSVPQTYAYVVIGKRTHMHGIEVSKVGNHLGSIDLGFEYDFRNVRILLYRQNFYDVGALAHLANIRDGLNGISISNKKTTNVKFFWKKIVAEFFYSKDQAGYPWSIKTASGDEDYYNNYQYRQGWSYQGSGLGNPLITPAVLAQQGLPHDSMDYFINNRVVAINLGVIFYAVGMEHTIRLTGSQNFGTFATSIYGRSTGTKRSKPTAGIFPEKNQFSAYLSGNKNISNGYAIGYAAALDLGNLLNNSFGLLIKASKEF